MNLSLEDSILSAHCAQNYENFNVTFYGASVKVGCGCMAKYVRSKIPSHHLKNF